MALGQIRNVDVYMDLIEMRHNYDCGSDGDGFFLGDPEPRWKFWGGFDGGSWVALSTRKHPANTDGSVACGIWNNSDVDLRNITDYPTSYMSVDMESWEEDDCGGDLDFNDDCWFNDDDAHNARFRLANIDFRIDPPGVYNQYGWYYGGYGYGARVDILYSCDDIGDQVSFGTDSWIGYAYDGTSLSGTYYGYMTESESFDQSFGAFILNSAYHPTSCRSFEKETFSVRYKMRKNITECGYYLMSAGSDDGLRLYVDGNLVINSWVDRGYTVDQAAVYLEAGTHDFVLEYYENVGGNRISFNMARQDRVPASGSNSITACCSDLYDSGGPGGNYSDNWNGYTVIYPSDPSSVLVLSGNQSTELDYDFLRIYNGAGIGGTLLHEASGNLTLPDIVASGAGIPLTVRFTSDGSVTGAGFDLQVACCTPSTAPLSITGSTDICLGSSTTLSVSGGSLGTSANWQWYAGGCGGTPVGSGPSITVSPTANTTYYVRAEGQCGTTACATATVNVTQYGDPAVFGNGTWRVYAYDGRDWNLGAGVTYLGYYEEPNLSFNTTDRWASSGTPASASGYQGCDPGVDNHTLTYKRTNFACGQYAIDVNTHDDEAALYVNGQRVWFHSGCCDAHDAVWVGYLDAASTLEFRHAEGGGGSGLSVTMNLVTPSATVNVAQPACDGTGTIQFSNAQGLATPYFISDFASTPTGISTYGSGVVTGGVARLTQAVASDWGAVYLDNPSGWNSGAFHASFDFRIWDGSGADGFSFNYGPLPALTGYGAYENGITGTGLSVNVRTYTTNQVEIEYNGSIVATAALTARSSAYRKMTVYVDRDDAVTVAVDGVVLVTADLTAAGYPSVDKASWEFGFAARTGGATDQHSIDNVFLTLLDAQEYSINGGASWQSASSFPGLAAGSYPVRVRPAGTTCTGDLGSVVVNDNTSAGTAETFGTDEWYVSCYDGNNYDTYFGYYTNVTEEFNIGTHGIGVAGHPGNATGYAGCTYSGNDNWSLVARRQGFPCAEYTLEGVGHDDAIRVRVDADDDGIWEYDSGEQPCCDILLGNLHTTVLDASSKVEIRVREFTGNAYAHVRFNDVGTALAAGSIPTDPEVACTGYDPVLINSVSDASGGDGTLTYQWQQSVDGGAWTNLSGANSPSYDPSVLGAAGSVRYQRVVSDQCGASGTTGNKAFTVSGSAVVTDPMNNALCAATGASLSAPVSGGANPILQWTRFDGSVWSPVADGTPAGVVYSGASTATLSLSGLPADGSWTYRLEVSDDGLGCPDPVSAGAIVTNESAPPAATAGQAFQCADNSILLTGNDPGAYSGTWSILTGSGTVNPEPTPGEATLDGVTLGDAVTLRYTISTGTGICPDETVDVSLDYLANLATPTDGTASCTPNPAGGLQYVGSPDGETLYLAINPLGNNLGTVDVERPGANAFSTPALYWSGLASPNGTYGSAVDPARMPAGTAGCPDELFVEDSWEIDVSTQPTGNDPELVLYLAKSAWDAFVSNGNAWLDGTPGLRASYEGCYNGFPAPSAAPSPANATITGYHADGLSLHALSAVSYDAATDRYLLTFTTDRFSGFALHGSGSGTPLPVELVTFTGQHAAGSNHLSWITAAELNTLRFDVERSADGLSFETLGSVEAAGWSSAPRTYAYVDAGVPPGGFYYRLKVVDIDGSVEHSRTIWLSAEAGAPAEAYAALMPNPTTAGTELRFWLPEAGRYTVSVRDAVGRQVFAREGQGTEGLNRLGLDLGGEAAGTYVVTLTRPDGLRQPLRLVKSTD